MTVPLLLTLCDERGDEIDIATADTQGHPRTNPTPATSVRSE
jgi:hypothetical protein